MSERPFSSTKRRKVFVTNEAEALRALNHGSEEALAWFIDRYSAYVHTIISYQQSHRALHVLCRYRAVSHDYENHWIAFNRLADMDSITEIAVSGQWTDENGAVNTYDLVLK